MERQRQLISKRGIVIEAPAPVIARDPNTGTFNDFLDVAKQLAEDFKDEALQHQVVALLVKRTKLIGYGVNQLRYLRGWSYFDGSLHAEADLIRRQEEKIVGGKVLVYRFNNAPFSPLAGEALCAKPCQLCQHLLRNAGAGRVVWLSGHTGLVESRRGGDLPLLTGDPSALTRRFLEREGSNHHGKFHASDYLVIH